MTPLSFRVLVKLAASVFSLRLGGAVLALILQVVLARWLGAGELGTYVLTVAVAGVMGIAVCLGFPSVTPRFIPPYLADKKYSLAAGFVHSSRKHLAFMSAVALSIAALAYLLPSSILPDHVRIALGFGSFAAPFLGLMRLNGALAVSLRYTILSFLPDLLVKPAMLLAATMALVWFLPGPNVLPVLWAFVTIVFLLSAAQMFILQRRKKELFTARAKTVDTKTWSRAALPMTIVVMLTSLIGDLDILLLALLLSKQDIAIFSICFRLAMLTGFVLQVIFQLLMPDLSKAYARNEFEQIMASLRRANGLTIAFAGTATLLAAVYGEQILGLFGEEFRVGAKTIVVLMAVQLVIAMCGPNVQLLNLAGQQNRMIPIFGSGLVLLGLLNIGLATGYGINGAAAAFVLASLFWHTRLSHAVYYTYGFHGSVLGFWNLKRDAGKVVEIK